MFGGVSNTSTTIPAARRCGGELHGPTQQQQAINFVYTCLHEQEKHGKALIRRRPPGSARNGIRKRPTGGSSSSEAAISVPIRSGIDVRPGISNWTGRAHRPRLGTGQWSVQAVVVDTCGWETAGGTRLPWDENTFRSGSHVRSEEQMR